jgi:hypothetical protein
MQGSVNLANHGLLEFRLVRGLGAGHKFLFINVAEIRPICTIRIFFGDQEFVHISNLKNRWPSLEALNLRYELLVKFPLLMRLRVIFNQRCKSDLNAA